MKKRLINEKTGLKVLVKDSGDTFSVTGMTNGQVGTIHDVIIDNYPDLEPVIKVHQCNTATGAKNLYESSVVYFAGMTEFKEHKGTPLPSNRLISEELRCTKYMAKKVIKELVDAKKESKDITTEDLEDIVRNFASKNLSTQWEKDAIKAMEVIKSITDQKK